MDVPEYKCGVRQEENKTDKLSDSYSAVVDSGYDSIYNGCASVLMEKSFGRDSFDILFPNSPNRTPGKHPASALKYHVSTPKASASIKRHLYSSFNTNSYKRSKCENNENEPKTAVNASIRCKPNHVNDGACPLKALHNYDFSPQKYMHSTSAHQSSFINESLSNSKHSIIYAEDNRKGANVPEKPSKGLRYFEPLGKHSKRKLDIPPVKDNEKAGQISFRGTLYLNIIGKLEQFPLVLDELFKYLSSKDLLNVSLVSKNWNSIVKSNPNANSRIQHYLNESRNVKENLNEPTKPAIIHKDRHPFSQFNILSTSNKNHNSIITSNSFSENQKVVEQLFTNERLVKCPRCTKGSIIYDSSAQLHSTSLIHVPTIVSSSSDSDSPSLTQKKSDTICNIIRRDSLDTKDSLTSENYGVCTSLACKFTFCLKCHGDYHPGKTCITSGPESPSKLLICHKKLMLRNMSNSKISSKRQSLRRLCFP